LLSGQVKSWPIRIIALNHFACRSYTYRSLFGLLSTATNQKSRMIRIAVIASLIVAIMLQPFVVVGLCDAVSTCGDQSASALMCAGCGCCEVSQSSERCCCCGSSDSSSAGHASEEDDGEPASLSVKHNTAFSTCLCGKNHQQLPPQTGQTNRVPAVSLPILSLESYQWTADQHQQHGLYDELCSTARPFHFAQQFLSVWLI
jgi:hypothetical protein